ncbi:hypothetical protein [Sphingobacterium sp. HMA12]|uniref:hypothetical protein n=1 Tax=Sphingobacterium sp. HMA12 TaxID=2050894 RepID=UPI000CEA3B83|nr:hypothetical protein [Sphingobacterium sp. HMA12]
MNKLFTTAALVCALSLGFTSCSKDDDKGEENKLSDATAVTAIATIEIPAGAKVFYDFKTNTVQEEGKGMINLSGTYGSTLQNTSTANYKMGYFDKENTSIEKLTLSSVLSADIKLTDKLGIEFAGKNQPTKDPNWIIYDHENNYSVDAKPNRYVVLFKGEKLSATSDELYVIQAGKITALRGDATYNINFKKFLK